MLPAKNFDPGPRKHAHVEWAFILLMLMVCAGLTALQYHWTGEVSRAEVTRLRGNLDDQAKLFCRAFDAELQSSSEDLCPTAAEIEQHGREAAHRDRLDQWTETDPRPIFSRVAVAIPDADNVKLFNLALNSGQLEAVPWPAEWAALQKNLLRKRGGPGEHPSRRFGDRNHFGPPPGFGDAPMGFPPAEFAGPMRDGGRGGPPEFGGPGPNGGPGFLFVDPSGRLSEMPVFTDAPRRGGGPELEWMVFELDVEYAKSKWIPDLIAQHFGAGGKLHDIEVRLASEPGTRVFATSSQPITEGDRVTALFNPQLRAPMMRREAAVDGRWLLQARHRPGALDALVSKSRRRNLGLGLLLNALVLVTGIALVRYTRGARRLAESQLNFVASVSHELRTPLTVIRGAADNISRGIARSPEQLREYSHLIIHNSEQLKGMVDQVLASAGARNAPIPDQPVSVGELLGNAVAAEAEEIEAARCSVDLEFPPDLPPVRGNAAALQRAVQNLISNAAKHGGTGKLISVSAAIVAGTRPMVEIRVRDEGPGIPRDEQDEIFKPFSRGAAAQARAVRGAGLGLSVVREIVEAHRGSVALESAPGAGTAFILRLPALKTES